VQQGEQNRTEGRSPRCGSSLSNDRTVAYDSSSWDHCG